MLSNLGNILLFLNVILSLSIIYTANRNLKISGGVDKNIFQLSLIQSTSIIICFFVLIAAFIASDFSLISVYQNSHSLKPLFYKIAGTWGNHEGSLLLWAIILSIFSFLFLVYNKNHPKKFRLLTLIIQNILILGFLFFILFNSNPFSKISPIPSEGLGLNPILQDPALAIHPPLLYVGFVGASIYFSAAIASLITNYSEKSFSLSIKNWVLISWCFQTLGILVGSIWAYYELGWGGFWFWDPVENVSLMPWICLTALIHCILVFEKREILKSWTIILSIATFTLSMCGTFLVRSGILNSVHTFANDPARGIFILSFLFLLIFLSLIIFFFFNKEKQNDSRKVYFLSKEVSVLINNWFLMYFLSVVLIGTVYPIFLEVITSEKISVGPPFFHKLIIPFLIPFLIFMAIGPQLKWIKSNLKNKLYLILFLIISFILTVLIVKNLSINFFTNTILLTAAFFLFFITVRDFFKKKFNNLSQNIAHFGFSLLILSILFNNIFSSEIITNLKIGETFVSDKFKISFKDINQKDEQNYKAIIGKFEVIDSKGSNLIMSPELRIYNQPNIVTSEADIKTNLLTDKFMTMNFVQNQEYFNIRYQIKPFMIWIWISVLIISFGGLISLFYQKNEK